MWSDKKERTDIPAKSPESTPAAKTMPPPTAYPRAGGIGKAVVVKGKISSQEDLYVDGEVQGTLELPNCCLTIGPNGKAEAANAREIVVQGTVNGNVEATGRVTICKDGRLIGDIRTARIVIEDGAYFKGNINILPATEAAKSESVAS